MLNPIINEGEPRHLLIVEDDSRTRQLLKSFLYRKGYRCTTAEDTIQARHYLDYYKFDLIIMDVMLPGQDGVSFTKELKNTMNIPVIILSAMGGSDSSRIDGLVAGAEDYIPKPFNPEEIVFRIDNILKRITVKKSESVDLGKYQYKPIRGELTCGDIGIQLTETESKLLHFLASRQNKVVSRQDLGTAAAINNVVMADRSVDILISRLRRKIENDPKIPRYLKTVRGKGYILVPEINDTESDTQV